MRGRDVEGAILHDPKAASVVDHHRRLHGLETQNQAFLCGDKNDRGDDSDDRCDKSQPIMKRLWLGKAEKSFTRPYRLFGT
jgi:hypothetical protein